MDIIYHCCPRADLEHFGGEAYTGTSGGFMGAQILIFSS